MKTNEEYMQEWFAEIKTVLKLAAKTCQMYKIRMEQFNESLNKKSFVGVKRLDIINYLSNDEESISNKKQKMSVVLGFYDWMCDNNYINKHPMMKKLQFANEESLPKCLEPVEQEAIQNYLLGRTNLFKVSHGKHFAKIEADSITHAKEIYSKRYNISYLTYIKAEKIEDIFTRERDYVVTYFALNSGLRASEILNLKVSQINFEKNEVKVIRKRNKERIVHIHAFVIRTIKKYIEKYKLEEYVFPNAKGGRWAKSSMDALYTNISKVTGIDVHIHQLRHTYGQNLYDGGVKLDIIREQMGHTSAETTKIYVKVRDRQVKDAVENINKEVI